MCYPIILPQKNWVTKLIIKHHHELGNHVTGTNQILASLSTRFWIIAAREAILEWEKECAMCQKRKAKMAQQIMAPLPLNRLTTSLRAFTRVAVDFGGPFMTAQGSGKPRQEILVFVYMLSFKSSTFGNGLWFGCRLFFECIE